MSNYDYLEAVFLHPNIDGAPAAPPRLCRAGAGRARLDRAATVAAASRAYGHLRVWAILFLLVSPVFSKPFSPLVPRLYQSSQDQSSEQHHNTDDSDISQDQLTLSKESPFLKRPNLFSQNFARPFPQKPSANSFSINRQSSLPKSSSSSTSFLVKDNSVSNLSPVYNSQEGTSRVLTVINNQQENFLETQNEVEDFVRLNTVNTDNHFRKTSNSNIINKNKEVYSSDTSSNSSNVKLLNSNNSVSKNYSSGTKRPLSQANTRGSVDQEVSHSLVKHLNQQKKLFPSAARTPSIGLPLPSPSGIPSSSTTRGRLTVLPTISASPGEEFNLLDGPEGVSSPVIVSRVPRHTAEPTRLEQPTSGSATFLEVASSGGMDSTDNARTGRGGSGSSGSSSNSRITDHWSQPCRIVKTSNPMSSPAYLSGHIYNNVNVAHKHAHRFKQSFASHIWDGMAWETVLNVLPTNRFDFLNQLEVPTEEQLKNMQFNDVLPIAYESMQRRAVAIEQVTLDQALYRDFNNADLLSEFRAIEGEIVSVLCELHYAMIQQGVTQTEVITAEIMEEKFRDIERTSERATRDTVILIEYLSGLDYLLAVFNHFKNQET